MNRMMRNLIKPIQYKDNADFVISQPATAATDDLLFTCTQCTFWEIAKGTNFDQRYQDIANIVKVVIHVQVSGTEQWTRTLNAQTASMTVAQIKEYSRRKKLKVWLVATYGGNPANVQPTSAEVRAAFTDHYLPFWKRDGSNQYNDLASRGNPRHIRYKNNDIRVIKKFTLRERGGHPTIDYTVVGANTETVVRCHHPGFTKKVILGRKLIVYNADASTAMERPTGLFWVCLWPFAQDAGGDDGYHDVGFMTHNISSRTYFYST